MAEPQPWEYQKTDTAKSWEAFQVYRDMGKKRTLAKVADELGKSTTIIQRWSSKHNWKERIEAWEVEQDRLIRIELMKDIGAMRKRHADMAEAMIVKAALAMQRIPVDEMKWSDISRMVDTAARLERLSRGDVGDVIEERVSETAMDPVVFYIPDNSRDSE